MRAAAPLVLVLIFLGVDAGTLTRDADGAIYPQRSIARVKLGMSQAQVKAQLGRPALKVRRASYTTFYYLRLTVKFRTGGGVVEVETTRSTERTRSGVGIGSTEKKVRRGVRGVECGPYVTVMRLCRVGSGAAATKATDFLLYGGRVRRVTLTKISANPNGRDTSPPTRPANLTVVGTTKTTISVSWDASTDDVAVLAYFVYRNGLLAGGTTKTRRTFSGLACGASYRLGVDARDAAGNRSAQATIRASTSACSSAADLFVSSTGADTSDCTKLAPCLTFNRAYRVADPGQVIEVAGGTYPGQTIKPDASKTSEDDVLFRPRPGEVVSLTGKLLVHASHLEFRGMSTSRVDVDPYPLDTPHPPEDITFRDMRASGFDIMSASNISVIGGDYGPATNYGSHIKSCSSCKQGARNILIEGVHIHDIIRTTPGRHVDCLHVWNTDGLVVQESTFSNCEDFNILFTWTSGHTGATPNNIVIQNNFFDCCRSGWYSLLFASGHGELWRNVLVQYNSSNDNFGVSKGSTDALSNIRFYANIAGPLAFGTCGARGITVDYNVWTSGKPCGKHDAIGPSGFVAPAAHDFHLAPGAPAIGRGHPTSWTHADIDGDARPHDRAPDAGADQAS